MLILYEPTNINAHAYNLDRTIDNLDQPTEYLIPQNIRPSSSTGFSDMFDQVQGESVDPNGRSALVQFLTIYS
jgi:hypothetical protein